MKALVTGGAGFIGSNLVDRLISDGHEVVVIDDLFTGKEENINPKAEFYKYNIRTNIGVSASFPPNYWKNHKYDVVFHLAALARVQPSIDDPIGYHDVNVNGTLNMLKFCVDTGVKRFVFSSSSSVYGDVKQEDLPTTEESELNPMSPYALHKLIGEQYCTLFSKLYGLETVCLRYFNVYGERQPLEGAYALVVGIFIQQLLNNELLTINGTGEQKRDFTYVGDVVEANIKAGFMKMKFNGDIFNIGNGDNRSVNQLADIIGGNITRIHRDPIIEPKETLADNGKARFILNWDVTMKIEDWIEKYKKNLGI